LPGVFHLICFILFSGTDPLQYTSLWELRHSWKREGSTWFPAVEFSSGIFFFSTMFLFFYRLRLRMDFDSSGPKLPPEKNFFQSFCQEEKIARVVLCGWVWGDPPAVSPVFPLALVFQRVTPPHWYAFNLFFFDVRLQRSKLKQEPPVT